MKLLFIARAYPPKVGGMEKFARDFYESYKEIDKVDLLANGAGRWALAAFVLRAAVFILQRAHEYDVIHCGDAVLAPLLPLIRVCSKARVTFTVHGLDIVYTRFGYQHWIPPLLRRADRIFAVSHYTRQQCIARGIPEQKIDVIPNGVRLEEFPCCSAQEWAQLQSKYGIPTQNAKIMLTVGRLIRRKGHAWFIEHVMPKLPREYVYLIAGDGPEHSAILQTVNRLGLQSRVWILGQVTNQEKSCLFHGAHLFVMPNVTVLGDQEGFGIVLLEAGVYGLPVIATNIEGIRDAVMEGRTGHLVEEGDAKDFAEAIVHSKIDALTIKSAVTGEFDWKVLARKYHDCFQSIIAD